MAVNWRQGEAAGPSRVEELAPWSNEGERALLGALLVDQDAVTIARDLVTADDFFADHHRALFQAICELADRKTVVDLVTVARELEARGQLDLVGGPPALATLIAETPTSLHTEHYARLVRNLSRRRKMIQAAGAIAALAYREESADIALEEAQRLMRALETERDESALVPVSVALESWLDRLSSRDAGLPTGLRALDALTGGLPRGALMVVAARPGMGKSAFLLTLARRIARQGERVAMFSLEMGEAEVCSRLLAIDAGVSARRLLRGTLTDGELENALRALENAISWPFWLDTTPNIPLATIRARLALLARHSAIRAVIVDYLQLMDGGQVTSNRATAIAEITRGLKALAREYDCTVIAASQLNREIERRADDHPRLSDLRESGTIEQDADIVLFLHRPEANSDPVSWAEKHPGQPFPYGKVEAHLAKHRHGPTGKFELLYLADFTAFVNAPEDDHGS